MIKIVCVAGATIKNSVGGPSGYLYLLRKSYETYFKGKDVSISFIAPEKEPEKDSKFTSSLSRTKTSFLVNDFLYPAYYFFSRNSKFRGLVAKNKHLFEMADIIHCHSVFDLYFLRRYIGKNKKIVLTTHTPEPPYSEMLYSLRSKTGKNFYMTSLFFKYISDKSLTLCNDIIYPSKGAEDVYKDQYPNYARLTSNVKKHFVYTCVDQKPKDDFLEEILTSKFKFKVGFLGRFNHVKGFDLFLDLATAYKNKDIGFFSAGSGPIKPDVDSNVISLGRISNPRAFLNSIDLLVVPNRSTYFDIVVLESIAQGTPFLIADNGGNSDLLNLSSCVHSYGVDELAQVLECVDKFPGKYSEELRRIYVENFDISKFAEVMADKYHHIIRES